MFIVGASRTSPSQPLLIPAPKTASGGKIRASRFTPGRSCGKPLYRFRKPHLRGQTRVGAPILVTAIGNSDGPCRIDCKVAAAVLRLAWFRRARRGLYQFEAKALSLQQEDFGGKFAQKERVNAVRMEEEMSRSVSGRRFESDLCIRYFLAIDAVPEDAVEPKVNMVDGSPVLRKHGAMGMRSVLAICIGAGIEAMPLRPKLIAACLDGTRHRIEINQSEGAISIVGHCQSRRIRGKGQVARRRSAALNIAQCDPRVALAMPCRYAAHIALIVEIGDASFRRPHSERGIEDPRLARDKRQ